MPPVLRLLRLGERRRRRGALSGADAARRRRRASRSSTRTRWCFRSPSRRATPTQPVTLRVDATFGVCSDVCIPTQRQRRGDAPLGSRPDPLERRAPARASRRACRARPSRAASTSRPSTADDERAPDRRAHARFLLSRPLRRSAGGLVHRPAGLRRTRRRRSRVTGSRSPAGRRTPNLRARPSRFVAVSGGEAIEKAVEIPLTAPPLRPLFHLPSRRIP